MNIVKTAIIVIVLLIVLSFISYFIPYKEIISSIPFLNSIYNNASLTVNSKNGKALVFVDGKEYGETPTTITNLIPGEHFVELQRVSDTKDLYQKKEITITIQRGTEAIIDYEISPGGITSGYVLYYTTSYKSAKDNGFLTITSKQDNISITLDDELLGKTPINAQSLKTKSYELKASKLGFEDLKFPIIIRNGYNLNIQLLLLPIPTNLTK